MSMALRVAMRNARELQQFELLRFQPIAKLVVFAGFAGEDHQALG
jgi:hypothetical protein